MAILEGFLTKAIASLAGAVSEFAAARYDNCANRCYYACFQAAIYALANEGIRSRSSQDYWEHDFVRSQFAGLLVNRRKIYPVELRNILESNYSLRRMGDYEERRVGQVQARRALERSYQFIGMIQERGGREP